MREFLDNLNARFATTMVGRYGNDDLNQTLFVTGIVFLALSIFGVPFFSYASFAVLVLMMFRMMSRNASARAKENEDYLRISEKPRSWWNFLNLRWINRKTTAYIKCPNCKKYFTLPKGKGKIRATCPHCHEQSEHNV